MARGWSTKIIKLSSESFSEVLYSRLDGRLGRLDDRILYQTCFFFSISLHNEPCMHITNNKIYFIASVYLYAI